MGPPSDRSAGPFCVLRRAIARPEGLRHGASLVSCPKLPAPRLTGSWKTRGGGVLKS